MIFDAHVHLPWQEKYPTQKEKLAHLLETMEKNGVTGALIIADSLSESDIGTNEQVVEVIKGHKNIFMAAGYSPIEEPEKSIKITRAGLKRDLSRR